MYEWAKNNDRVVERTFRQPDLETRPPQGTAGPDGGDALPDITGPLDMLPTPDELRAALSAVSGLDDPMEAALKASLCRQADHVFAQWTASNQQNLGRNRGERRAAGRSTRTWKYIKKVVRSAAKQRKIDMVPWQSKAILNRRETLRQVYDDRVALQGGKFDDFG